MFLWNCLQNKLKQVFVLLKLISLTHWILSESVLSEYRSTSTGELGQEKLLWDWFLSDSFPCLAPPHPICQIPLTLSSLQQGTKPLVLSPVVLDSNVAIKNGNIRLDFARKKSTKVCTVLPKINKYLDLWIQNNGKKKAMKKERNTLSRLMETLLWHGHVLYDCQWNRITSV